MKLNDDAFAEATVGGPSPGRPGEQVGM